MPRFRIAKLFDVCDPVEGPRFSSDHPRRDDPEERQRILEFLNDGPVVIRAAGRTEDRYDPSKGAAVPIVTQTDGEWIWNAGHAYYLANYGLALEPDFHNHIRNKGHRVEEPSRERVVEALRFLQAEQARQGGRQARLTPEVWGSLRGVA